MKHAKVRQEDAELVLNTREKTSSSSCLLCGTKINPFSAGPPFKKNKRHGAINCEFVPRIDVLYKRSSLILQFAAASATWGILQ
jgi:hypothetical protein